MTMITGYIEPTANGVSCKSSAASPGRERCYFCSALAVAGVILLLSSCVVDMPASVESPSFTHTSLRSGGVAVLGVVGWKLGFLGGIVSEEVDQGQADSAMGRHLARRLNGMKVIRPDEVKARLAAGSYKDLRKALGHKDLLSGTCLQAVHDSLGGLAEFLIDARMVGHWADSSINWDSMSGTGNREILVQVNVFQTSDGKLVWSRRMRNKQTLVSDRNSFSSSKSHGVAGLFFKDHKWAPATPPTLQVLDSLFDSVGATLADRP